MVIIICTNPPEEMQELVLILTPEKINLFSPSQIQGNISQKIIFSSNLSDEPTIPITALAKDYSYKAAYKRSKKISGTTSMQAKLSLTSQYGKEKTSPASEGNPIIINDFDEETDALLNSPT